jgi:hypothetical protein
MQLRELACCEQFVLWLVSWPEKEKESRVCWSFHLPGSTGFLLELGADNALGLLS